MTNDTDQSNRQKFVFFYRLELIKQKKMTNYLYFLEEIFSNIYLSNSIHSMNRNILNSAILLVINHILSFVFHFYSLVYVHLVFFVIKC